MLDWLALLFIIRALTPGSFEGPRRAKIEPLLLPQVAARFAYLAEQGWPGGPVALMPGPSILAKFVKTGRTASAAKPLVRAGRRSASNG